MALGILATIPAVLITAPWRRVPGLLLAVCAGVPAAALCLCYVTPTQFAYARDLAVWPYAANLAVIALAYARTARRCVGVVVTTCLFGLWQVLLGLVDWQAGGEPTAAVVGRFFQQDIFGALSAAISVTAVGMALYASGPRRILGWIVAPVTGAAAFLSTSRAAEALLVVGLLGVALAGAHVRWTRRLGEALALASLTTVLLYLLTGPLLFADNASGAPLAGTTGRTGSDAFGSSLSIRWTYWTAALDQFWESPLRGLGFGSYGLTFEERAPVGAFASRFAHNGVLHALAEGGLLLGVPVIAAVTAVALACVRGLVGRRGPADRATEIAIAAGATVLLLHSAVDVDWSFPVIAGLTVALAAAGHVDTTNAARPRASAALAVLLLCSSGFAAVAARQQASVVDRLDVTQRLLSRGAVQAAADNAVSQTDGWFPNPLVAVGVLLAAAPEGGQGAPLDDGTLRAALMRTRALADLDPDVQLLRSRVLISMGDTAAGLALGERVLTRYEEHRPRVVATYARLLLAAHHEREAAALLARAVEQRARPGYPLAADVWALVVTLQSVAGPDDAGAVSAFRAAVCAFGAESRPVEAAIPSRGASCPQ